MIKYVFNTFGTLSLFGEFVRLFIREVEEGGSLDLDESLSMNLPSPPVFLALILSVISVNGFGLFDQILDKFDCIALLLDTPCAK